jgi:hypothetical protein
MFGFIGTSVTASLNYNQYSTIADLHTFQFTVAHALWFSVSASRLLATDLNAETITWNHYEVFLLFRLLHSVLHRPNLYSTNLHSSLRTCSILVFVLSTAPHCTALHSRLFRASRILCHNLRNRGECEICQHYRRRCLIICSSNVFRVIKSRRMAQNCWVFGLCPSSGILKFREDIVSKIGSVSIPRWVGDTYFVGPLRKN